MKTRMTRTSLLANLATDKPKGCALIYRYIVEHTQSNYKQIATGLKMPVPTVLGRINDLMYIHQLIKITGISNNMQLYSERNETDPLNIRPKSQAEILTEKLEAVRQHCRLTERHVNEIYQNYILSKLQIKMKL